MVTTRVMAWKTIAGSKVTLVVVTALVVGLISFFTIRYYVIRRDYTLSSKTLFYKSHAVILTPNKRLIPLAFYKLMDPKQRLYPVDR